jgi:hypothetical protein
VEVEAEIEVEVELEVEVEERERFVAGPFSCGWVMGYRRPDHAHPRREDPGSSSSESSPPRPDWGPPSGCRRESSDSG